MKNDGGIKMFLHKVKNAIIMIVLAVYGVCLVVFAKQVSFNVTRSLERCMNVIIPSLFAFIVFADVAVKSDLYRIMAKPFALFSKYILGMPVELFGIFLISNTAGYPIGAKLLSELVVSGKTDRYTAGRMLCFCYGAGPAFFVSVIGLGVFGNAKAGMVIFLSCFCTNILLAGIMCRLFKMKASDSQAKFVFDAKMLNNSVLNAGKSLFALCAVIIFFSTFMALIETAGFFDAAGKVINEPGGKFILSSFFEITHITQLPMPGRNILPVAAALCSFGGMCVIMQIKAVLSDGISLLPFLITRPICGIISALNSIWIGKIILNDSLPAFSYSQKIFVKVNNFIPSVCLILMIFMLKTKKGVEISK